ncbi:diguanylate cyclase domain-containing protein [Blastococcus sp. SYSU D00695]
MTTTDPREDQHAAADLRHEVAALRTQLRLLQSAAGEPAADDPGTVLHQVLARAVDAAPAPAHLLTVVPRSGGPRRTLAAGLPEDRVSALADRLAVDGDLGPDAVVVELASTRHTHGRLAALYPPGTAVPDEARAQLAAYAAHATAALDLVGTLADARAEADRAAAQLLLAHELACAPDAAAVCTVVTRSLPALVDSARGGVLLWEPAEGLLRPAAALTPGGEVVQGEAIGLVAGSPLRAEDCPEVLGLLTNRVPQVFSVEGSSPGLAALLEAVGASDVALVPLRAGHTVLGAAAVWWSADERPGTPASDELMRLWAVGDQAASALHKAQLLEAVQHQATHDPLTGLPNRVLFVQRLEAALAGLAPHERLGVLFCDLNGFKQVNDTLGHAAGDELLRQVGARLNGTVRGVDTVARLSGDEFAVLLPGLARAEDAAALAARVAGSFAPAFRLDGREVPVGTSVGTAVQHGPGGSVAALLSEADAAMYEDKGRRRLGAPARS